MKTDIKFFIDALRPAGKFSHTLFIGIAGVFEHYSISNLTNDQIPLDAKHWRTLPVCFSFRGSHIPQGG
jgi:hypothetical protein